MSQTFRIVNGDWVISPAGTTELVSDLPKLGQDFSELLTINPMPNGFGAGLESVIGTVGVPTTIAAALDSRIRSAIQRWQVLQQRQRAVRSLRERVAGIATLRVQPPVEKVNYAFSVAINSEDPRATVTRSGSV
jgi:hypothetical protein